MTSEGDVETELTKLRSNADNLANCLSSLLKRIEELETEGVKAAATPVSFNIPALTAAAESPTLAGISANAITPRGAPMPGDGSETVTRREFITVDPITGRKKRTTVTEHTIRAVRAIEPAAAPSLPSTSAYHPPPLEHIEETMENGRNHVDVGDRLLASAYEARIVTTTADLLNKLEIEFMCGEAVVMKVGQEVSKTIHPGDTILEVNGQRVTSRKHLYSVIPSGVDPSEVAVTLKLVLSDIYNAPMEFCKVLEDHTSNEPSDNKPKSETSPTGALPYLSFNLRKGDVLQVLSKDKTFMQARKVNDLSKAGFVPSNIKLERVAMLSPYGRRTLLLLGAAGVGRRTLKAMLLEQLPHHFTTVVPLTSRAPRTGEQEGREYHFHTKEDILRRIRDGQMIEWGEHQNQLYGTSAESVRRVIRSGRVCVLDCAPKALKYLYNREFMPYVVVLAAPKVEELIQMTELRQNASAELGQTEPQVDINGIKETCEQSERLLNSEYAKHFHLVLINRNRDVTLRRLLEALHYLKNESQWVPLEWLS